MFPNFKFPNLMKTQSFHIATQRAPSFLASFRPFSRSQKGLVRKNSFRETLIILMHNCFFFQRNLFLTLSIWYPLFCEFLSSFTKMEDTMKQLDLLHLETLPARVKYDFLFEPFPLFVSFQKKEAVHLSRGMRC